MRSALAFDLVTYPTGDQYDIALGEQAATVTELGAGLRRYAVGGRDVVAGYDAEAPVKGGRGQQLLPWPNRIRDGRYSFGGVAQQLVLSEPKRSNASHGLVRYVPWALVEHADASVTQRVRVYPQPGWAGTLEATLAHRLTADGLEVTIQVTNLGEVAFPFGYGAHPYLTVGEDQVDDVALSVPAARRLEVDERLLPVALSEVSGTPADLRGGEAVGDRLLDSAYTGLARGADGRWRARLERAGHWSELWADASFDWIQVFTGDDRRDIGIALEPMTCGPDAFNPGPTHDGMRVLEPAQTFSAQWGVSGG